MRNEDTVLILAHMLGGSALLTYTSSPPRIPLENRT